MLTRKALRRQILRHLEGAMTVEDLAAWADEVFRTETFEPSHADQITDIISTLRDAVDPHRFRWEEPDLEAIVDDLEEPSV
jgi:hypothetical protein